MTIKYLTVDTVTGKKILGAAVGAGSLFVDEYFTATSGQTIFTTAQAFTALSQIDVLLNGVEQREGVSFIYQRDASLSRIIFNSGVLLNAEIKIRIWL